MIKKIIDVNGQAWTVVVQGDTIRFYDGRYMHTEHGQFVSEYYTKTILDHGDYGLNLDFGVPTWSISASGMQEIILWLKSVTRVEYDRDEMIEKLAQHYLERADQKELEELFLNYIREDLEFNDDDELKRLLTGAKTDD